MQVDLATRHIARLSRFALDGSHHCANHDRAEPLILLPRIVPAQTTLLQFEKTARELAPLAPLLEEFEIVRDRLPFSCQSRRGCSGERRWAIARRGTTRDCGATKAAPPRQGPGASQYGYGGG